MFTPSKKLNTLMIAGAVALMVSACGNDAQKAAGAGGPPPAEVEVLTIQPGKATVTRDLPGRLQAWRTAQVRARVEGVLEKRFFTEGTDVKAGQILFRIDPRSYKAAADAAKADADLAKLTVERYRKLFEIKAVSKQELDQAEAKLKQAESVFAKANIDYENTAAPAPIAGRIGRALVTEGALVGKGEATHLATIEQIDTLYANFTQTNTELLQLQQQLKAGGIKKTNVTKVEVVLEDGTVYSEPGKLLFSDLAVDPNTGAVNLRAEIPNKKKELLPGMFVRIRFPQAEAENVIIIPQRAMQSNTQGQFVMVVDAEGKVAPRPVVTSGMSGSNWVVTSGLKAGESIIVNGLQKARPGSTVKPVPWNPNAPQTNTPAGAAQSAPAALVAKPEEKKSEPAKDATDSKPAATALSAATPAPAVTPAPAKAN